MSDTTETETETNTTTDEPTKAELHDRVQKLESTVEKLMPSRRDALKLGAAGIAGAAGLGAATQTADASTGSAGTIGSSGSRPDAFLDEANVNQLTGVSTGADRQGCRVFLSSNQSVSAGNVVKVQFDSEVYDSGNNFDTSTHEWSCPKDGLHLVNAQARFGRGSSGDQRSVRIGNGSSNSPPAEGAQNVRKTSGKQLRFGVSTVNEYAQGDTIALYVSNLNSNDELRSGDTPDQCFLEVAFLGGL